MGHRSPADDVMFVYHDVLLNDELATQIGMQRQFWSPTDEPAEVVKIDDYHVRFTFPEPYPVARYHFTFELGLEGKIILPQTLFSRLAYKVQSRRGQHRQGKRLRSLV